MKLTANQERAVAYAGRNLQLIACAGSGKTEVIARRVVRLLMPGSSEALTPGNIIAFTFTEKAAAELKDRIGRRTREAYGEIPGMAEMFVGTIHAFCLELLKSESPRYLKYEVLNQVQQTLFVDRFSKASGLTESTTLNGVRLKRYTDTAVFSSALNILREDTPIAPEALGGNSVAAQLPIYEQLLHDKHYLDYSAILKEAVSELKGNEGLRARLAERVKHVIVDEYQDVNPIQESVVEQLHGLGAGLCVVGDDDQTIYQWRGSEVRNILRFEERYPNVEQIRLEENFRSSEGVIAVARDFIDQVPNRLPKAMKAQDAQKFDQGDITALNFDTPEDEASHIARLCQALRGLPTKEDGGERGICWSDMAILLRSVRRDGATIMHALDQADVRYVITGMDDLFRTKEVQAARALFYFLANEIEAAELRAAWLDAKLGIDVDTLEEAVSGARRARSEMGNAEVGQYKVYNLQRQFVAFLERAGLREERAPDSNGEVLFYNLGKFSQAISDFESINFHSNPVDKYKSFAGFLRYHAEGSYPEGWQENAFVTPNAVRIMTVHQAKGLEWPVVFLPQLVRNRFPSKGGGGRTAWHLIPAQAFDNATRYKGGLEDEQRLFYVAVTRAQKFLHMSWAPHGANKNATKPSEFFSDVQASKCVKRRRPDYEARPRIEQRQKASVANVTLSFSDLKYFFECPYQFKLRILYGFNAPLDEALGYGKSLHDALAEVHARALRGEKIDAGDAEDLVERHLHTPYAYTALRKTMEAAARRVVAGYIEKNASQFMNLEFAEKGIEIALGDGVSVAGRIDLVRRIDNGEVTIVDLKSNDRAQVEAVTETQLHIYALGYQELTGRPADYVEIYELDEQKQKRRSVDDEFIDDVKRDVREAAAALRKNELPPMPNLRGCSQCDYRNLCSSALVV